jgi:hypothetical protein
MEVVLRDHYFAEGANLSERINRASSDLPKGANAAALHRLRRRANAILHLDPEEDEGASRIEPTKVEKEIISPLFVLRSLIEEAPPNGSRYPNGRRLGN